MSRRRSTRRCLPWLLLPLLPLLTACFSGFTSNQPPAQTYVLTLRGAPSSAGPVAAAASAAPDVAPASAGAGPSVEVLLPTAVAGLSGDGVAVLRPGQRLDYYTGGRWAAAAPLLLQTLIIQTLRRQGRFALVEADTGPFAASYLLSVQLTHFEADYDGQATPTVRVELVCELGRSSGRQALESFTAEGRAAASADRMQAVVEAFEQATNTALGQLGERLRPPALAAAPGAP